MNSYEMTKNKIVNLMRIEDLKKRINEEENIDKLYILISDFVEALTELKQLKRIEALTENEAE